MHGTVNTWNVREYAPKGQVPEFIYDKNYLRKNHSVGSSVWKWNFAGIMLMAIIIYK